MGGALASAFLAALDRSAGEVEETAERLEARLTALVAAARESWPAIPVDPTRFVEHAARCVGKDRDPLVALEGLRAADLWLAHACAGGEPLALRALESGHLVAAARALARFGDARGFVADALQELRRRLLVGSPPRIAEYAGQGSLTAWIRVAAVRVAINLRRHEARRGGDAGWQDAEALAAARDPELEFVKAHYRGDFSAALRDAFDDLTADERTMLRFYLIDRLNIAEIGSIFGVGRSTVGRWIVRCRERILASMRDRLKERLQLTSQELDSLMGEMRSQVDLSLSQVLRSRGPTP
ncbi:MAG TPA: sigma-70 family RNA polymerase sigma factor [Kofleriaceae bacterium]|nr:sigma-70 family RNA polymerase sigma factor [Kofleriaceae bacterium]